ncbi:Protein of unknown function, partial [Gryllus bimaculatus]
LNKTHHQILLGMFQNQNQNTPKLEKSNYLAIHRKRLQREILEENNVNIFLLIQNKTGKNRVKLKVQDLSYLSQIQGRIGSQGIPIVIQ